MERDFQIIEEPEAAHDGDCVGYFRNQRFRPADIRAVNLGADRFERRQARSGQASAMGQLGPGQEGNNGPLPTAPG